MANRDRHCLLEQEGKRREPDEPDDNGHDSGSERFRIVKILLPAFAGGLLATSLYEDPSAGLHEDKN